MADKTPITKLTEIEQLADAMCCEEPSLQDLTRIRSLARELRENLSPSARTINDIPLGHWIELRNDERSLGRFLVAEVSDAGVRYNGGRVLVSSKGLIYSKLDSGGREIVAKCANVTAEPLTHKTTLGFFPMIFDSADDEYTTPHAYAATVDGESFSFSLTLRGGRVNFNAWNSGGYDLHAHDLSPRFTVEDAWKVANH